MEHCVDEVVPICLVGTESVGIVVVDPFCLHSGSRWGHALVN